jgi:hypothetical protein
MARRRLSKSLGASSENGGTESDHFARSRSADELSDDADLLEIGEALVISSDEEKGEKKRMTKSNDRSNGEKNRRSVLGSVAEINNTSSGTESEREFMSGDVKSGNNKACSVENRGQETRQEVVQEKAEADRHCLETVDVAKDGVNKKKRQRSNFNPAGTIPVGWRTRSYTKKGKRVDYTSYYKNIVSYSDSKQSGQFEESDTESDSESCTNSDSGSDKQGIPPEDKRRHGKHKTVKSSIHCLDTGTVGALQRKQKGTHKGVGTPASSSDCSVDIDDVPVLERLNKVIKHNRNDDVPFEEFEVVSVSSSDDADEAVRNSQKKKKVTKCKGLHKSKSWKTRRGEIHDKELFDFLMRSLNTNEDEALGNTQDHLPREMPMVFDFGSDNELMPEKSEFEKLIDEAWGGFDFALGIENLGSYKPDEVLFIS